MIAKLVSMRPRRNMRILIKYYRERAGMTQQQLSRASGVTQQMISYIEQGARAPSLETLEKLAKALAIKISDLLKD